MISPKLDDIPDEKIDIGAPLSPSGKFASKQPKPSSAVAVEKHENGRVRVSRACSECKKAHTRCNFGRPCSRCLKLGLSCVDIPSGTKRGRGSLTAMENYKKSKDPTTSQPASKKRRFCPKDNVEISTIQQLLSSYNSEQTATRPPQQQTTTTLPTTSQYALNQPQGPTTTIQTQSLQNKQQQQNYPQELQMFSLPGFAQNAYGDLVGSNAMFPQNAAAIIELSNRIGNNKPTSLLQQTQQQLQQQIQQQPIKFDPNDTSFLSLLGISNQNLGVVEQYISLAQQDQFNPGQFLNYSENATNTINAPTRPADDGSTYATAIQIAPSELHYYDGEQKYSERDIEDFFDNNNCNNQSCEFYDNQHSRCAISGAPNAMNIVKKNLQDHNKIYIDGVGEDDLDDGDEAMSDTNTDENGVDDDFQVPQASESSSPALSVDSHTASAPNVEVKTEPVKGSASNSPLELGAQSRTFTVQKKCQRKNGDETLINTLIEEKILYDFIDGLQNSLKTNFSTEKKEEIKMQIAHMIDAMELREENPG